MNGLCASVTMGNDICLVVAVGIVNAHESSLLFPIRSKEQKFSFTLKWLNCGEKCGGKARIEPQQATQ